jgi:hypothetical protein
MVALVADSDFYWDGAFTILFPYYYGPDVYTVTFTHGFENPPEDVTAVVQSLAARAIATPTSAGSLTGRSAGPFSESYAQSVGPMSLLDTDKAALAPYRIVKVM